MESCCIYICSVGPIEDCCVMLLLRFPPARKCLVGTFESFLCGFGEFFSNLHRSDSEGVTYLTKDACLFLLECLRHGVPFLSENLISLKVPLILLIGSFLLLLEDCNFLP